MRPPGWWSPKPLMRRQTTCKRRSLSPVDTSGNYSQAKNEREHSAREGRDFAALQLGKPRGIALRRGFGRAPQRRPAPSAAQLAGQVCWAGESSPQGDFSLNTNLAENDAQQPCFGTGPRCMLDGLALIRTEQGPFRLWRRIRNFCKIPNSGRSRSGVGRYVDDCEW